MTLTVCLAALGSAPAAEAVTESWRWDAPTEGYAGDLHSLDVDPAGNVFTAGWAGLYKVAPDGRLLWHYPEATDLLAIDGEGCAFIVIWREAAGRAEVAKLDGAGRLLWSWWHPDYPSASYSHLAVDREGGVVVAARLEWVESLRVHARVEVVRLDAEGAVLWAGGERLGRTDYAAGVVSDSQGRITLAVRSFVGAHLTALYGFDAAGTQTWREILAGGANDVRGCLALDSGDAVYALSHSRLVKIGPAGAVLASRELATGGVALLALDGSDRLTVAVRPTPLDPTRVLRFDEDLALVWEVPLASGAHAVDLAVDPDGRVYVSGYLGGTVPRMLTTTLESDGTVELCDVYSAAGYAFGDAIAVDAGAFYTLGCTWESARGYGSLVLRYAVEVPATTPVELLTAALEALWSLDDRVFRAPGHRLALSQKLEVARDAAAAAEAGDGKAGERAAHKLVQDVLPKLDGCAVSGGPDGTDWVACCAAQGALAELLSAAVAGLTP